MWSSNVAVHPWIGENYDNPTHFKYKTLILGESNFTSPPDNFNSSLVIRCVKDDLSSNSQERDTNGFCRFSTKLRRIIFGQNERLGPNGLWQDVAFYNFIQMLVGDSPRIRPTQEMWADSIPAFNEVINLTQPLRILVLGKANWNNLINHIPCSQNSQHAAVLNIGNTLIQAGYVNHPSSSLSYAAWHPIAQQLLL